MSYTNTLSQYRISDGWNEHLARGSRGGVDYAVGMNTPIPAPCNGRLENRPDNGNGFGNYIRFHHGDGFVDEYLHLDSFVGEGNYSQGQIIGYSGTTGNSTGPHVHWHLINPNGVRVNPLDYVGAAPAAPAPAAPAGNNVIQPGDGYWHIAERVWGGDDATITANMNKLIGLNGGKRLYAGDTVILEAPAPAPAPVVAPVATPPAPEKPAVVKPEKPAKPVKPVKPVKPTQPPAPTVTAKPTTPAKERKVPTIKPLPKEAIDAGSDALGILIPEAKNRKIAYAVYGLAALVVSNVTVGVVVSGAEAPVWLIVASAVIGNLAVPFTTLAIANASKTTK
jgi:hypothetical protein